MAATCARSQRNRCARRSRSSFRTRLLFSTTIRENIAYGRPDATEEEIIDAARRAQADEFIRQMPNGYASAVGERGGTSKRWPTSTHRNRPRISEKRADSLARRTNFRARSDNRGRDHGNDQGTDARPNDADRHASTGDNSRRRSDRRDRTRPHRRAGPRSGTARARRRLRETLRLREIIQHEQRQTRSTCRGRLVDRADSA